MVDGPLFTCAVCLVLILCTLVEIQNTHHYLQLFYSVRFYVFENPKEHIKLEKILSIRRWFSPAAVQRMVNTVVRLRAADVIYRQNVLQLTISMFICIVHTWGWSHWKEERIKMSMNVFLSMYCTIYTLAVRMM